jgi:hypothetical protein
MDFYALDESEREGSSWSERQMQNNPSNTPEIASLPPISTANLNMNANNAGKWTSYVPTLSPITSNESIPTMDRQRASHTSRNHSARDAEPATSPSPSQHKSNPDAVDLEEWRLSYGPEAYAGRPYTPYEPPPVPANQPQTPQLPPHVAPAAVHQPPMVDATATMVREYKHSWLNVSDTMADIKRLLAGTRINQTTHSSGTIRPRRRRSVCVRIPLAMRATRTLQ